MGSPFMIERIRSLELILSILLVILFSTLFYVVGRAGLPDLGFYPTLYIALILLSLLILLLIVLAPIDIILVSTPAMAIALWILNLRVLSRSLMFVDPLSMILLIGIITPFLYRLRRIVKPPLLLASSDILRGISRYYRACYERVLLDLGLIFIIIALSAMIFKGYYDTILRVYSGLHIYLPGVVLSSILLSSIRRRYLLPLSLLSWIGMPLSYYLFLYKSFYLEREALPITPSSTGISVLSVEGVVTAKGSKYYIELSTLRSPHIIILGSTGSGKTLLGKRIGLSAFRNDLKVFILDLHGEYQDLGFKVVKLEEIVQGILKDIFSRRESIDDFIDFMRTIFRLGPIQVSVLSEVLEEYIRLESDPTNLIPYIEKRLSEAGDTERERIIRSLLPYLKIIFESIPRNVPRRELDINQSVVIDLESIRNNSYLLEIYSYYLIRYIWNLVRLKGFSDRVKYIMIIDEAHNILKGRSYEVVEQIFRESRKYGFGVIILSQQIDERILNLMNNAGVLEILKTVDPKILELLRNLLPEPTDLMDEIKKLRELEFISIELGGERRSVRGKILLE